MADFITIIGGLGTIALMVLAVLAFLAPIFLYLTQRNTYQTRQELRKVNKNLEALHYLLGKQTGLLQNKPTTPAEENFTFDALSSQSGMVLQKKSEVPDPEEKPISNTVTMTCEHCGKTFKYGKNHSGKYKPCPGCEKPILLK